MSDVVPKHVIWAQFRDAENDGYVHGYLWGEASAIGRIADLRARGRQTSSAFTQTQKVEAVMSMSLPSFCFRQRAKLKIWWEVGFPVNLGFASDDCIQGYQGLWDGKTIWLRMGLDSNEGRNSLWVQTLEHEILHAKIAAVRKDAEKGWRGRRDAISVDEAKRLASKADLTLLTLYDGTRVAEFLHAIPNDADEEMLVMFAHETWRRGSIGLDPALEVLCRWLTRPRGSWPHNLARAAVWSHRSKREERKPVTKRPRSPFARSLHPGAIEDQ